MTWAIAAVLARSFASMDLLHMYKVFVASKGHEQRTMVELLGAPWMVGLFAQSSCWLDGFDCGFYELGY